MKLEQQSNYMMNMIMTSYKNLQMDYVLQQQKSMSPGQFFDEFRHIAFKNQRGVGKTDVVKQIISMFPNSCAIVFSYLEKKRIMRSNHFDYLDSDGRSDLDRRIWVYDDAIIDHLRYARQYLESATILVADQVNMFRNANKNITPGEYLYHVSEFCELYVELT